MGRLGGNKKTSQQTTALYELYKNRTYDCTLRTFGNVMLQPTMYFVVRHMPMFNGTYIIRSVKHSISPGAFNTEVKGQRLSALSNLSITSELASVNQDFNKKLSDKVKTLTSNNSIVTLNSASNQYLTGQQSKDYQISGRTPYQGFISTAIDSKEQTCQVNLWGAQNEPISSQATLTGLPYSEQFITYDALISVLKENVTDVNGINLSNVTVNWADPTNFNWQEQFAAIINASLVNSQRIGRPGNRTEILGVDTSEYTVNLVPGYLPVIPYTATVDGISMPFEAMTSTTAGRDYIYEPSPVPNSTFNVLYRNDKLGYQSANNGYFFLFKQGTLQNQDFNLAERISNRTVNINIEGVNNEDRWLFQLDDIGNINREWQYTENIYTAATEQQNQLRPIYSTTSRTNDQITMVFGDGVFSEIPVGTFRAYVRSSNGLQYIINPEEMQNVVLPISYIDRNGNLQTITFTCGITQPVSNAQARESIDAIKQRAPARYYTQNRMVNGEDYNLFPFTAYNSIIKSKAVNRASIGTSRWLDLVDNTGKYSSTNTFSSDGAVWRDNITPTLQFTYNNTNQISDFITNQVQPEVAKATFKQFYYENFPRIAVGRLSVTKVTVGTTYVIASAGNTDFLAMGAGSNEIGTTFTATAVGTGTGTVYVAATAGIYGSSTWHQSTTLANETTGYFLGKPTIGGPGEIGRAHV